MTQKSEFVNSYSHQSTKIVYRSNPRSNVKLINTQKACYNYKAIDMQPITRTIRRLFTQGLANANKNAFEVI